MEHFLSIGHYANVKRDNVDLKQQSKKALRPFNFVLFLFAGGSMVGMRNVLAIRLIVDFWSSAPLRNKTPNIHVLLGKIEDNEGTSPSKYFDPDM